VLTECQRKLSLWLNVQVGVLPVILVHLDLRLGGLWGAGATRKVT
jgi:hypothetical protein